MLESVKSKKVFNIIFEKIKMKLKLKLFVHNKSMQKRFNITIKDYQNLKAIKKLNQTFKLNIEDDNISILKNHSNKKLGYQIFEYLLKVEFKNLKILSLNNERISHFNLLPKLKFENLEQLLLGKNKISNIDILSKANFKKLKVLDLNENDISNIQVLEKVCFEN